MKKVIAALFLFLCLHSGTAQTVNTSLTYSVNLPKKQAVKTPVLIMLHGYGSNEADLFDIAKALDERFITFSLRAPNTIAENSFCWYALETVPGQERKYNYSEAKDSKAKIMSFISNACKAYKLDSTQVFIMGFSQGAIMAYDLAITSPKKIKGVLALSGRMMEESKLLKTDALQLAKVKFYIAHGNADNVIKITEAEKAVEFLKTKNVSDLVFKTYEMQHSINGKELNDIKAWLVKAITPTEKKPG